MEKHVQLVAIANLVLSGLNILLGLVGLAFLVSIQEFMDLPPEARFFRWVVGIFPLVFIAISLPGLIAGFGLLKRAPWARILAMVVAVFHIPNMPIGTALGIYTFWVLLDDDAAALFE